MAMMRWMIPALLLVAYGAMAAEQYYQVDPAKLAAIEASRCAANQKEASLIRKRLTGNNRETDVARMKAKLQTLEASIAKSCTAQGQASAVTPAKR